ncbi:hypothetical protein AAHA92_33977 [Salvia divinorum]|uniref:Uncharacterized protein n=1 Tax=Salvia divinorum TaxID=28513 RepID=A0ABD1FHI2_SALDI
MRLPSSRRCRLASLRGCRSVSSATNLTQRGACRCCSLTAALLCSCRLPGQPLFAISARIAQIPRSFTHSLTFLSLSYCDSAPLPSQTCIHVVISSAWWRTLFGNGSEKGSEI